MQRDVSVQANELLQQFYVANGTAADAVLERLAACARLDVSRFFSEKGDAQDDIEDLCGETIVRFVDALRRSQVNGHPISDGIAYAKTIAYNVFNDYMRDRKPVWYRLKRRMFYLLDEKRSHNTFARWQIYDDWLGGFVRWRGQPFRETDRYRIFTADRTLFCQNALFNRDPAQVALPELLSHLFGWLDTPLEVDALTTHVAALQRISDPTTVSVEGFSEENEHEEVLPPSSDDVESRALTAISDEQFRAQLWREICDLPPRQRAALLLGMERDDLLLLTQATQVAETLNVPLAEFIAVWRSLPLTDKAIAERLQLTTLKVSNLRKCARERLVRRMKMSQ